MEKAVVFLGGTCNGSTWREKLIPLLKVSYFDPVVDDWNEEAQAIEDWHKANDSINLYVVTPKMTGVYSVAEVVDDSNKKPENTMLCILQEDDGVECSKHQWKSFVKTAELCKNNGIYIAESLEEIADYLNSFFVD